MEENMEIQGRINALHQMLTNSDYKAIKFAEGSLSEAEFASARTQRQAWRDELNQLEAQI